jgi:predicted ATPase
MLTRLKVSGFKNLDDLDVRFGPFTCIAGANGAGKSNLFDAIRVLGHFADGPLLGAALRIRGMGSSHGEVGRLFRKVGDQSASTMSFVAEMIIAPRGLDEFGVEAKAGSTFVEYSLELRNNVEESRLEIVKEELKEIDNIADHLFFPSSPDWLQSSITQGRGGEPFISTAQAEIRLHREGIEGKDQRVPAHRSPRTMLSGVNSAGNPTALLARREMQSWQFLYLEPSHLRSPSHVSSVPRIHESGSNVAATLFRLAESSGSETGAPGVYAQLSNRLFRIVEDVRDVWVTKDDQRELLTLYVRDRNGTVFPARDLSDGALRLIAFGVLEQDPEATGLVCVEEPENGVHPGRISAILEILKAIAVDTHEAVDADNPLRQVIINTHSPVVVGQVPDDSLLIAESKEAVSGGHRFKRLSLSCLTDTWRSQDKKQGVVSRGKLLAYLNPFEEEPDANQKRVIDRRDIQELLPSGDRA